MLKNKKLIIKIIVVLLVIILLLVTYTIIKNKIDNYIEDKIKLGEEIYNKMHNLYYYGEGIDYEIDDENQMIYIEEEKIKYYKIKNYNELFKKSITDKKLKETEKFLNIKEVENNYYIKEIGRGLSGYYGTKLKLKKVTKNKIEYKAISTLCQKDSIVTYGEGCTSDGYYEVEKPFTLVKEDGLWKVSEYTSVFQFSDRDLK